MKEEKGCITTPLTEEITMRSLIQSKRQADHSSETWVSSVYILFL